MEKKNELELHKTPTPIRRSFEKKTRKMTSSSASPSVLRDLCHALSGDFDFGSTFSLVERGGETEPSGKENSEATRPLSKTRQMAMPSTPTSSSPALDDLDALDAALDDGDRALTSKRNRRTRHRLRARIATNANSDSSDSAGELSATASLGATAAFLEAAARVLTSGAAPAAAAMAAEACAFGWELSRLLEEYRECVLELEARVSEEEEAAAEGNGDEAKASSSSAPSSSSSSPSSSSLPLPVPRIRLHLGEWPVVLEEIAALAELALECMGEDEEEEEEKEKEGEEKKTRRKKKKERTEPSAVPPAAALARAAAALSRCGAPRVEAAAGRISAAIERAQLIALADWCARGEGAGGGFWVVSRRRPVGGGGGGGEEEEEEEAEKSEDLFSSFELVAAAFPPFLSSGAARDALFVGCAARAFSSRQGRTRSGEEEGDDDGGDDGENGDAGEETRRALLSLLSPSAAPEDDSRLSATSATLRPTAVASVLAEARERAERRLFRRCFRPRPAAAAPSGGGSPSPTPLRAALESLRRVALLGDAALWGTALRSGHLRAALEKTESGGGAGGGGGGGADVSSALEAAADDARGAATPAALEALFSRGAPLRLSVVLLPDRGEPGRSGGRGGKDGDEEALWSRLKVRRERAAWPLGLLPLFSSPSPLDAGGGGGGGETGSSSSRCCASSSSSDPWRTVESLFSTLLALERASLALEEAYLSLKSAARGKKALPCFSFSASAAAAAAAAASAGNGNGAGGGGRGSSAGGQTEDVLLSLWRAHRDAAFAVRGALSHLREDVLAPADRELDAALLRLQEGGAAGAEGARPWTLAAAALGRWRSRVASSSLSLSSPVSSVPVAEALGKLCRACHAIRSAVELASFLEGEAGGEEEERGGDARALAAASASALLGAAAGAGEAARALAAAAEAAQVSTNDDGGDDFAASHRAMLLGRVSFG